MTEQLHPISEALKKDTYRFALFHLGFRPFFLAAMIFAIVAMLFWLLLYLSLGNIHLVSLTPVDWHAHEMIYGYSMAVIVGFLLTAIRNWTGIQTVHGPGLIVLVMLWLGARLMPFIPMDSNLQIMAGLDLMFMLGSLLVMSVPIVKAKQWNQMGIILIVSLLLIGNLLFYLGALQLLEQGVRWGLYVGLYVVLGMILIIGRRVIPFFIEKGVNGPVAIKNWHWIDITTVVLFILFAVLDVFTMYSRLVVGLALGLCLVNCIRLYGWYTSRIFSKPLLWVLYLAYIFLVAGFAMKVVGYFYGLSTTAYVHLFTIGGIGLMTTGMMARVTLGHTGRNVFEPPAILIAVFALLVVSVVFRVFLPLLLLEYYLWWIVLSQLVWIVAFSLLLWTYLPMLIKPRIDGRYG
jgi:uncharacterized protein involved in response to NO